MDETYFELENDQFVLGIPIQKVDAENRIVEGFATLDNVDKAGDILDADASKNAFSKWAGNIREMHQKKAVGRKVNWEPREYTADDGKTYNGIWVAARISKGAEDTWQKVLDGTLSGFSVGGGVNAKQRELIKDDSGSERNVWRVTDYSLGELSLVDNPCNGLANIELVKFVDDDLTYDDTLDVFDELQKDASKSDSKEPYGDVVYADPGYQADGKKRYPIDSPEHAKAAWDYINQTDNAHLYKPGDLGKVKSAIERACKKFNIEINKLGEPMGEPLIKSETGDSLAGDDDASYIKPVLAALVDWQKNEISEGDQIDVGLIAGLIQRLNYRVRNGDGTDESTFLDMCDKDDDGSYIRTVIKALQAWQKSEVDSDGDQSDVDLTSDLITSLNWRLRYGDNTAGIGDDDLDDSIDSSIDRILEGLEKDGDGAAAGGATGGVISSGDTINKYPSQHIAKAMKSMANFRGEAKKNGKMDLVHGANHLIGSMSTLHNMAQNHEDLSKLHDNNINDISDINKIFNELQSVRDFIKFNSAKTEEINKNEDSEMDEKLVKEAIAGATEALVKANDERFDQIGESLAKVAKALEAVATTDSVTELTKSFEEKIADIVSRIEAVEQSGAVQKAAESSGEALQKSQPKGFWTSAIVPPYVEARVKEGR